MLPTSDTRVYGSISALAIKAGVRSSVMGLVKSYPQYAAQVWLYQAYLDLTENPCLYTIVNADSASGCISPCPSTP